MAYKISKSDGSIIVVPDYENNITDTSLALVGRGQINFGEPIATNLVRMLENFSSPIAPANPIKGQLWFQAGTVGGQDINRLKIWNGVKWALANTPFAGPNPPLDPELGDLWFNTTDKQMYYWSGLIWEQTSQIYTSQNPPVDPLGGDLPDGTPWYMMPEGMLWIWDNTLVNPSPDFTRDAGGTLTGKWRLTGPVAPKSHSTYQIGRKISGRNVLLTYVNGDIVSIETSSATFLAGQTELPGFVSMKADGTADASGQVTVHNGITINQTSPAARFGGTAINSTLFDKEKLSSFLGNGESVNVPTTPITNLAIDLGSNAVRWKGVYSADIYAGQTTPSGDGLQTQAINLHGKASFAATADKADKWTTARTISLDSGWIVAAPVSIDGSANVAFDITAFGPEAEARITTISTASAATAIGTNNTFIKKDGTTTGFSGSMGTAGDKFNTIYATTFNGNATTANYADLGERYEADKAYPAGTIVTIGGSKEITETIRKFDPEVFGVISENPGFVLNAEAGSDATHPVVGLVGRVRVRVTGLVKKGQRIVTSDIPGVGLATSLATGIDVLCIVGRALEDKNDMAEGLVLCAIGMK